MTSWVQAFVPSFIPHLFVHNKSLKLLWEVPYTLRQELSSSRINIRGHSGSLSKTEGSLHSVKMCCHAINPLIHNRQSSHPQLNPQTHSVGRHCCTKYRPVSAFMHAPLGLRGNARMDVQSSTSENLIHQINEVFVGKKAIEDNLLTGLGHVCTLVQK